MTDTQATAPARYLALDFIRGIAVMGILLANLLAFGMPEAAYFSPLAWGGTSTPDIVAWFATFVLVEGKMRGMFSFLFGASMLLVIERAEAGGDNGAAVHFRRMAVLFVIGCCHLYLIWWGDILAHYALVGSLAWMFVRLPTKWLVGVGCALILLQTLSSAMLTAQVFAAGARATPEQVETWNFFATAFGVPPRADLLREVAAYSGSWTRSVAWRWNHAMSPFTMLPIGGSETLGYMLFGMAALRSGFVTGEWSRAAYRRWAAIGIGIAVPLYVLLALNSMAHGYDQRWIVAASLLASTPLRPVLFTAYVALLVLVMRPGGWLTMRVAAAGRCAFTNYLGTSIVMSFVFDGWGLGLFGTLSRAQLYLLAPAVWLMMLAWSRPWLSRYRFGPLEWAWRTLSRGSVQPIKGAAIAPN